MTTTTAERPVILDQVEVRRVERLSPSFVRLELGGAALAEIGVDGPVLDQRIKLIFPHEDGPVPSVDDLGDQWYAAWAAKPLEERGHMRTYTIRDIVGEGDDTRMVVDIVLHEHAGPAGPGAAWAARAQVGDRVVTCAPRRGHFFGGIEFVPGDATRLLLVGDETAVPAIAGILRDLPADAVGAAYVEVPTAADTQTVQHPEGVALTWLPRDASARGAELHAAVLAHLDASVTVPPVVDEEVDPDLWETPSYSSSGETVGDDVTPHEGLYAWIAGESGVVTSLRRVLVKELGIDRRQVAFMGYWREGVAMKG